MMHYCAFTDNSTVGTIKVLFNGVGDGFFTHWRRLACVDRIMKTWECRFWGLEYR